MEQFLIGFLLEHSVAAPVLFIVIRSLALIIPPIPGFFIDSVGVLLFRWPFGFFYAWTGLVLGAMVSFGVARYFKEPLLRRFKIFKKISAVEHSLNAPQEFFALILMRVFSNPLLDYINFVLGFTEVSARKFFVTAVIGYFPYAFVVYFFGDQVRQFRGVQIVGAIFSLLVFVYVWRVYRHKNIDR